MKNLSSGSNPVLEKMLYKQRCLSNCLIIQGKTYIMFIKLIKEWIGTTMYESIKTLETYILKVVIYPEWNGNEKFLTFYNFQIFWN